MDAATINTVNFIFSLGTLALMAASLFLLVGIISRDKGPAFSWIARNALPIIFLTSLAGMAGSLTYQFIGFVPCAFCWYQRIVMYPIVFISLTALVKRRTAEIFDYTLVLAVIGAILATWHNVEKLMGRDVLACDAIGASCLQNYVKGFGFIDIPVMSLVFFIFIILVIATRKRFRTTS